MSGLAKENVAGLNQADAQALMLGGTVQSVSYDGSVQSAALAAGTSLVRLLASTDCHVVAGTNPTAATTTGVPLKAGVSETFGVPAGLGWKIAAIKASGAAAGSLVIYEAP